MIHFFYESVFDDFHTDMKRNLAASAGWFISVFTNFLLNDLWTWGDRLKGVWLRRVVKYYIGAVAGYFIQLGVMNLIVVFTGEEYHLFANLIGIGIATVANYLIFHLWSFRDSGQRNTDS
jgi:putative flippase GtrA